VQRINFILIDPNNTAEVELTRKLYKASHLKHLPLNYNQNVDLANSIDFKLTDNHQVLNIQLGNSATEANNHVDCLQVIRKFKNENIKLIIPLAYGRDTYAKFVKENANELFVDKVVIHERFISREEYVRNLNEVDIGIMYHNRSQAFGNCVTLLSLGKKLFLKSNNPLFTLFNKVGIKVFDANLIRRMDFKEFAEPLSEGEKQINISLTLKYFSNERRLEYLEKTLNYRDASLESAKSTEVLCNGK
ncbi:MAG: TDP-N-acetylfucosamine:lipid II N-acetylfucosaminyltransferase, partial [Flavisolibacter sp.]